MSNVKEWHAATLEELDPSAITESHAEERSAFYAEKVAEAIEYIDSANAKNHYSQPELSLALGNLNALKLFLLIDSGLQDA